MVEVTEASQKDMQLNERMVSPADDLRIKKMQVNHRFKQNSSLYTKYIGSDFDNSLHTK